MKAKNMKVGMKVINKWSGKIDKISKIDPLYNEFQCFGDSTIRHCSSYRIWGKKRKK